MDRGEFTSERRTWRGEDLVELADRVVADRRGPAPSGALIGEVLSGVGTLGPPGGNGRRVPPAAEIFDAFVYPHHGALRGHLERLFEVVAGPSEPLAGGLREGDVVVRRALGEPFGHLWIVAAPERWDRRDLESAGLSPEGHLPGGYARVVEGGARPHARADSFARRVTDAAGRVPPNQLVLRPVGTTREGFAEQAGAAVTIAELWDPPGAPASPPATNELQRPVSTAARRTGAASRTVRARFEPAAYWSGKRARWAFTPAASRGALPAGTTSLERVPGNDFDPATGISAIDGAGEVSVRVNMPPIAFNGGTLELAAVDDNGVRTAVVFEVPGIVVIDPGHGGTSNVAGSSQNNATSLIGVPEKKMTLDFGLLVRDALRARTDRRIRVVMTRETDVNVAGGARANVARDNGADVFLSIHFNGGAMKTRGTETFVRAVANTNWNHAQDRALARRVQTAVVDAIPNTTSHNRSSRDRGVKDDTATQHPTGLAVLSDPSLGNERTFQPVRACLVEIEFITNPWVDCLFNMSSDKDPNRQKVARAIADAIVDDLLNQQP